MTMGSFLKQKRLEAGFSRPQAAALLKLTVYKLDNWELNRASPHAKSLKKLMRLYGFEIEEYLVYYREYLMNTAEKRVNLLKRRCA